MTKQRAILTTAFAAAALLALSPSAANAQSGINDVIMTGRAHGVELSPETRAWLEAQGPDAFEFEHVWKRRVAAVRANRASFDASRREIPRRGAAFTVTTGELAAAGAVLDGTFRMPVLMGLPSGTSAPHPRNTYQERLFGSGLGTYSLTSFYAELSRDAFNFTGDVFDWVALPNTATAYYGTGNTGNQIFGNTIAFLTHTLEASDATVDFGEYDNDGPDGVPNSGDDDGYADLVGFLYPSYGRECSGPGIWAHRFYYGGWIEDGNPATDENYETNDVSAEGGYIRVADYIIQGGVECESSGGPVDVGLIAHESGHGFGLPDLYDTQATSNARNGVGEWDLMGSGNWNEPESPAHMSAHSKAFLGWIDVVTIVADTALTIEPILESTTAYRINIAAAANEYFLLENRQRLGADQFLNGTGLLIWHVDSLKYEQGRNTNTVNADPDHKGLDLEEADGRRDLDVSTDPARARGDAGDSYPGSTGNTSFTATTNPNSDTYASGDSNVEVTSIVETAGGDITLVVNVPDMITYGDVNADEAVTAADLDVVTAFLVGESGPDYGLIDRADVDDDGDVDARDAFIMHAYLDGVDTGEFRVGQLGLE